MLDWKEANEFRHNNAPTRPLPMPNWQRSRLIRPASASAVTARQLANEAFAHKFVAANMPWLRALFQARMPMV